MAKRRRAVSRPRPARTAAARGSLTTVAESREALDFWLRRLDRLPHRRRRARREARAMVARWDERHRDAVVAARARSALGDLVVRAGLEALLRPPRAPGGPLERRRRARARLAADGLRRRDRLRRQAGRALPGRRPLPRVRRRWPT